MIARSQIRVTHGVRLSQIVRVTESLKGSVVSPSAFYNQQSKGMISNRFEYPMTRAMTTTKLRDNMLNRELSPKYIKSVERAVRTINRLYGITSPTTENAIRLKAMLKENGRAPNTIRLYMWAMRYWAQSLGRDIDFKVCPTPPITEEPIEIIDSKVVRRILDCPNVTERNRAIIALFIYTACRVRELVELRLEYLDLAGGMVTYKGKRGKVRQVPLAPECIEIMRSWVEIRNGHLASLDKESPYVFITEQCGPMSEDLVRQTMARMKKEFGIQRFHPHQLRHTALTKMCNTKDVNLREVQQIAGHSSLTITERYTHVNLDQIKEKFTKNLSYN